MDSGASDQIGGDVTFTTGAATVGESGKLALATGRGGAASGDLRVTTGDATADPSVSGSITVSTGNVQTAGTAGAINIEPGASNGAGNNGANVALAAGTSATHTGGTMQVLSGVPVADG